MSEASPRPAFAPGSHPITAHGQGAFAFAGMSHAGSILATPNGVRAIEAMSVDDLDPSALAPLMAECAEHPGSIEFLIVGTGERMAPIRKALRTALAQAGLRFEAMATGPALRIYNVMQSEGRRVAAALIATP
ncbi:MAG: Mth938-like domain-containing protein [Roseiarcus sp.]